MLDLFYPFVTRTILEFFACTDLGEAGTRGGEMTTLCLPFMVCIGAKGPTRQCGQLGGLGHEIRKPHTRAIRHNCDLRDAHGGTASS